MNLKFNSATEKDISIINDLAVRIWKTHYSSIISIDQIDYMLDKFYSFESLLQQMNEGHKFTLVYNGVKPIGYISLSSVDEKKYFLHKFYIDIDAHSKGIGTKLFKHILMQIPNAETIELVVNRINYKSINFYFKLGFIIKDVTNNSIGGGFYMNDFLMIKKTNNNF